MWTQHYELLFVVVLRILCFVKGVGESCGTNGTCIDTTIMECDGVLKTGLCPGNNDIICCEPSSSWPERCSGSGPPLLNSSYLFTLKNQGKYQLFQHLMWVTCSMEGFYGHPGALVYVPYNFDFNSPNLVLNFPSIIDSNPKI